MFTSSDCAFCCWYAFMTSPDIIERIDVLMKMLAEGDWEHRTYPEFMVLLEEGEAWCKRMKEFIER